MDEDGGVHVLADGRGGEWRVNGAIAAALIAGSWAEAHMAFIAPILPPGRRVTMHVFVDQARWARRMLDTPVKFRLLAEVRVDDRAGWYCTALN